MFCDAPPCHLGCPHALFRVIGVTEGEEEEGEVYVGEG